MSALFQPSLFDEPVVFPTAQDDPAEPLPYRSLADARRIELPGGAAPAWIDVLPGWLSGADELFSRLLVDVDWRAERRPMYDRVVSVPRLLRFYSAAEVLPAEALGRAKLLLDEHYGGAAGQATEAFETTGLCLYRDGRDSVAWHGDRIGRSSTADTVVAILSLGAPRTLLLRPRPVPARSEPARSDAARSAAARSDAARSDAARPDLVPGAAGPAPSRAATGAAGSGTATRLRFELGHGDLLVMGGSCQRTWDHAVAKTARPVGPRISVQFRRPGVR